MDLNGQSTLLIVDDSPLNIEILKNILQEEYIIECATNGEEALDIIYTKKPDLILLDVIMSGINGHDVCRILKSDKRTSDIPIIFVSSRDDDFDEAFGFELGAVDYISKPVSPIVVHARVKTQLDLYNHQIDLEKKVMLKTREIYDTRLEIIKKLSIAAEYKDNDTGFHIARMSRYCYIIAKNYGLSEDDAQTILNASPMHDVGKIGIPDNILEKPGRLDKVEWEVMTTHSLIGKEILGNNSNKLLKAASTVAFQHHENWDGSGYPSGLKGEEIHIFSRIVSISDVFDALTSKRPYKEAWDFMEAAEYIRGESGKKFDPSIIDAFNKSLVDLLRIKNRYTKE